MSNTILFIADSNPFTGRQGKNLYRLLAETEVNGEFVVGTDAPDNKTEGKEYRAETIINLAQKHKPKVIVTFGNNALFAVTGKSGIMKHRGEPVEMVFGNHTCTVVPSISPGAIAHNPKNEVVLKADLTSVRNVLTGKKAETEEAKFKVTIIDNKTKLKKFFGVMKRQVRLKKPFAYDLETEGKEYKPNKRIWLMGIATSPTRGWVLPLEHEQSPWIHATDALLRKCRFFLEDPTVAKCAHNGKFDNGWLRLRGLNPFLNFDSILAQHLIDENSPKSLEFLAMVHFKAPNWGKGHIRFEHRYGKKGQVLEEPSPLKEMGKYCGIDCIYTLRLMPVLETKLMEDEKSYRIFKYISMPGSRMLERTESYGLYVDRERLGKRYTEATYECNKALDHLESFVPEDFWERQGKKKPKGLLTKINWNSPAQVGMFFFSKKKLGGLGLKPVETTKGGAPSTAEHTMIELEGVHPACDALLIYRKWAKYLNTYIEPWLSYSDNVDWRMHPTFKIWGTVTGRLSSENPNPQQTPRDKFLRANIGAPDGWTFIEGDYSQIELRVVAFLSGDPRMVRAYINGEDIHSITACTVTGMTMEELNADPNKKELRKMAKAVNFGFVYGMWWKKFKQYAKDNYGVDVTDNEAKTFRESFFKLYKGLTPWHQRQQRIVKATKQVRAPHGRIRHLPDVDSDDEGIAKEATRQAINSPVQGFASGDLTLLSAIMFDKIIQKLGLQDKVRVVLLVHDAIMLEVKDEYVDEIVPIFKGTMENTPLLEYFDLDFTVPIIADVQLGSHWGELEEQNNITYNKKQIKKWIKEVIIDDELQISS